MSRQTEVEMGWRDLSAGWRQTQLPASRRLECEQVLEALLTGAQPREAFERVHGVVRSSIRLHTRVHWTGVRLQWRERAVDRVVRQLPPLLFAPVSSLGRRLGGIGSDAPQDGSLVETWTRVVRIARAD